MSKSKRKSTESLPVVEADIVEDRRRMTLEIVAVRDEDIVAEQARVDAEWDVPPPPRARRVSLRAMPPAPPPRQRRMSLPRVRPPAPPQRSKK